MMKLGQLQALHSGMVSDVATLQNALDRLNGEITRIKSDGSRHDDWIKDHVDEARKAVLPQMGERVGTFGERLDRAKYQRKYWSSKPMVLSLQMFDADPMKDAAIRAAKIVELGAMDSALLQLTADSAIEDGNFPMIHLAYLAGFARHGQPGWRGINLEGVAVPEQAAALELIREIEGLSMKASNILGEASGGGLSPVRKLQTSRALGQG